MAGGDWDLVTPWPVRDVGDAKKDAKEFCELVPFESAMRVPGTVNDTWFAIVRGEVRCFNMSVQLMPLVYVVKPDYWEIHVVGCVGEICLPAQKPYSVYLDVTNTRGHKGIEIVGANKRQKIDIP